MMSEEKKGLSFALAVLMHSLIAVFLFFGVQWQTKSPPPVETELWQAGALEPEAPAEKPAVRVAKIKPVAPEPKPLEDPPLPKAKPPEIAVEKPKPIEKKKPEQPKPEPKKPEPKPEPVKKPEPEKKIEPAPEKKPESSYLNALSKKHSAEDGKLKTAPINPPVDLKSIADRNRPAVTGKNGDTLNAYIEQVRNKIKSKMTYPEDGPQNPEVVVLVKLLPDLTILDADVVKPSGNASFDDAVLRAIRATQQFPPLSKGILFEQVRNIKVNYKLKETNGG